MYNQGWESKMKDNDDHKKNLKRNSEEIEILPGAKKCIKNYNYLLKR